MEFFDVYLAGYIKDKEELAEAIKNQKIKNCTPWTNPGLDREPQLCQFFGSKSNSRTENPFGYRAAGLEGPAASDSGSP